MSDDENNVTALIRQAQGGNIGAFQELVYRYDRQVLSIAAHYINNAEDAKDIYQEVFLRVYRSLPGFRFQSTFTTWLYRITTNVCLTYRTRHRRHHHLPLDGDAESDDPHAGGYEPEATERTDDRVLHNELSASIERGLSALPPRQRMAFTLRHYEEYSVREIADAMECGEGTVKRYLYLATERLRGVMRRQMDEQADGGRV